jgi:dTDP-4-dehydrorhamnose 3,5-epimerase
MNKTALSIDGCFLLEHNVFPDDRGIFREWFKADAIKEIDKIFVVSQANHSVSRRGVVRGIHFSLAPQGQSKIVTCASGRIVDVLVDLRVGSPTHLQVEYVDLAEDSGKVVFIASGVGHGFVVQSDLASVVYLTSSAYAPEFEKAVNPTDSALGITWPLPDGVDSIISPADMNAPSLAQANEKGDLPKY